MISLVRNSKFHAATGHIFGRFMASIVKQGQRSPRGSLLPSAPYLLRSVTGVAGEVVSGTESTLAPKVLHAFHHDAPLIDSWGNDTPLAWSSISADGLEVSVQWADGEAQDYPITWLRDNCHCEKCYHTKCLTRNVYISDPGYETKLLSASVADNGQILSVVWSDGHIGDFPAYWLRGHRFDQSPPDPIEGTEPRLWGHDVMEAGDFRTFDFNDVLKCDDALCEWLNGLYRLGFGILKNAPQEEGQHYRLHDRLGYPSPVPSSSGVINNAKMHVKSHHPLYSEQGLQIHTDLTYYTQPRALQFFHCIQQAGTGGDSLLVDGFKVAEDFKLADPEAFHILTKVEWEFKLAIDKNYHLARHKTIRLDHCQKISQIVVNDICRTSMMRTSVGEINRAFDALRKFSMMLYHPTNLLQYKLEPGDILAFHNHRILHGRLGFETERGGVRHLQTCYSDWEIVSARMRTLEKQRRLSGLVPQHG